MRISVPRPVLGLVAAPLASALVHGLYVQSVAAAVPALLIAAAGCLCLGLPTLSLLARFGCVRAWLVTLAGVCAGVVASLLLLSRRTSSNLHESLSRESSPSCWWFVERGGYRGLQGATGYKSPTRCVSSVLWHFPYK